MCVCNSGLRAALKFVTSKAKNLWHLLILAYSISYLSVEHLASPFGRTRRRCRLWVCAYSPVLLFRILFLVHKLPPSHLYLQTRTFFGAFLMFSPREERLMARCSKAILKNKKQEKHHYPTINRNKSVYCKPLSQPDSSSAKCLQFCRTALKIWLHIPLYMWHLSIGWALQPKSTYKSQSHRTN